MKAAIAWRTLLLLAAAKLAIHLVAIEHYGYFRDELYYLASTEHLAWGYVDHPPLSIALLAGIRALLGDSLPALRLVPALAGAATVILFGVVARQLGGDRFAQGLAGLVALLSPVFLGTGHYYSMNALDLLLWTAAVSLLLHALERNTLATWAALGLVLGLGLLNKVSMLWLCGGLAVALLLTPYRRALRSPGPWLAASIAALLFLPHVLWQVRLGWPTLEFMRNAAGEKMVETAPLRFLARQITSMNPGAAPVWIAGIVFGLLGRGDRRGRVLVLAFLAVALLLLLGGRSRASYLSVAYVLIVPTGAIVLERLRGERAGPALRAAVVLLVVLGGALLLPFALPILPVASFVRYQAALGAAPRTEERLTLGALPQHYADMFGWEEMAALVERAYLRLTPEERRHCRIFGQNYGEAGAIDVLGRRRGLPAAISGHNSYWLWGPGRGEAQGEILVVIIIGGDREDNARFFDSIEIVGQTSSPWAMPYERGLDVSIARHPKVDLRQVWPQLRRYI